MSDTPDAELLEEFVRNQSEEAFAELVRRYVDLVHSVALRHTANSQCAEDITQAVFIILARKASSLGTKVILSGWLYHTARLTAANFQRAEMRRLNREQEAFMQSTTEEPESGPLWREMSPLLDEAMARLGASDRDAIVLRFFQNRSLANVGTVMGIAERAAQKRVNRALEKLRKFFSKRGVVSTTAIIAGAISSRSVQAAPAALAKSVTAVALAKGVAASISTLTLVKGALKVMAWTKVNTAIVVGAGVLLAAGTTMVTVNQIREHISENSWRFPNIGSDTIAKLPPEVKILPTMFPGGNMQEGGGSNSDKFVGIGQPTVNIVWAAYNWPQARVIFANGEPTNRYDFITTLNQGSREALQQELKDKLGLVAQQETRDMDVMLLEMRNPNAPGLHPPTQEKYSYLNHTRNRVEIKWADEPLSKITSFLESGSPVPIIDQTDATNRCSIDIKWIEDGRDPQHKALQKVLLNQLGLELVATNMPVEMLVVDKVN